MLLPVNAASGWLMLQSGAANKAAPFSRTKVPYLILGYDHQLSLSMQTHITNTCMQLKFTSGRQGCCLIHICILIQMPLFMSLARPHGANGNVAVA